MSHPPPYGRRNMWTRGEVDGPNVPHTGRYLPNSLAAHGHGPQRLYSHSIGGSDRFYGRKFRSDGRDAGYSYTMTQGPRGRVAPYNMQFSNVIGHRRNRKL
ncbi:hypothetical protein FB567DRAFT_578133 [Paraphoma chrysanthemicola]|uniref:Uncharacterized protein n=1 Tax=Paraphoma chrysanthemicola TaxID=798071 RepID=A0A8K0RA81_9PLEO|nr:hypothetical protein FB567DRAFT_578133 [Paraphoma chrysanthemicola]